MRIRVSARGLGLGCAVVALALAAALGRNKIAGVAANPAPSGPLWWRLVSAEIDEAPLPGADSKPNYFTTHPLDLMIPADWKLTGQVDWPMHKGNPKLAFHVDSPDGLVLSLIHIWAAPGWFCAGFRPVPPARSSARDREPSCLLYTSQGFKLGVVTAKVAIELGKISLHTIQAGIDRGETSIDNVEARIVEQNSGEDRHDDYGEPDNLVHSLSFL